MLLWMLMKKKDNRLLECYKVGFAAEGTPQVVSLADVLLRGSKVRSRQTLTEQDWEDLVVAYLAAGAEPRPGEMMPHFGFSGTVVYYREAIDLVRQHTEVGARVSRLVRGYINELLDDIVDELGASCEV